LQQTADEITSPTLASQASARTSTLRQQPGT
jgi:hypothetical protein